MAWFALIDGASVLSFTQDGTVMPGPGRQLIPIHHQPEAGEFLDLADNLIKAIEPSPDEAIRLRLAAKDPAAPWPLADKQEVVRLLSKVHF